MELATLLPCHKCSNLSPTCSSTCGRLNAFIGYPPEKIENYEERFRVSYSESAIRDEETNQQQTNDPKHLLGRTQDNEEAEKEFREDLERTPEENIAIRKNRESHQQIKANLEKLEEYWLFEKERQEYLKQLGSLEKEKEDDPTDHDLIDLPLRFQELKERFTRLGQTNLEAIPSPRWRSVFFHCVLFDCKKRDIAALWGVTPKTISADIGKIKDLLKGEKIPRKGRPPKLGALMFHRKNLNLLLRYPWDKNNDGRIIRYSKDTVFLRWMEIRHIFLGSFDEEDRSSIKKYRYPGLLSRYKEFVEWLQWREDVLRPTGQKYIEMLYGTPVNRHYHYQQIPGSDSVVLKRNYHRRAARKPSRKMKTLIAYTTN